MLQTVDVTRGPVSSVYGSGAIGGVANYTTIDRQPARSRRDDRRALPTAFETNPEAPTLHGGRAGAERRLRHHHRRDWRDAGDYASGDGTVVASAQDLLSGLVKARFRPADGHETTVSALQYHNDFDTGLSAPRPTTADTGTYTVGHTWQSGDLIDLSLKTYYNRTDVVITDVGGGDRQSYLVATLGADVFNTALRPGADGHELTYGFDVFRTT